MDARSTLSDQELMARQKNAWPKFYQLGINESVAMASGKLKIMAPLNLRIVNTSFIGTNLTSVLMNGFRVCELS